MRNIIVLMLVALCSLSWAEDTEEVWPEFPVGTKIDISRKQTVVILDLKIANLQYKRDFTEGSDQVAMSCRVVGEGTKCLTSTILLGFMAKQLKPATASLPGKQEIYFQVHYLTGRNSVRGYIPLMANADLYPTVEIDQWQLFETKILFRGKWSPKEHNFGIGVIRKVGRHLELKVFTNDPQLSLAFSYELTGLLGR